MKKLYLSLVVCLINLSINAQTGFSIDSSPIILLNNQYTFYNCAPIDFGTTTPNTLSFDYTLKRSNDLPYGKGTLSIILKYDNATQYNLVSKQINDFDWYQTTTSGSIPPCTISASQLQQTGSKIYLRFITDNGVYAADSCLTPISKSTAPPPPSFTLSPPNMGIACSNIINGSYSLIVNPSNIPSGANLTYSWTYPGWSGNPSTTNTIYLTLPNGGVNLPGTISVTPILNGVPQTTLYCTIHRADFYSNAMITGPVGQCTGSANYSISTNLSAGETVLNWFLTDNATSNTGYASGPIASLSNQSNSGTTVNFFGGYSALYLKAIVKNPCGQYLIKSIQLRSGINNFSSNATISGSSTGICSDSGPIIYNLNNLQSGESLVWSISDTNISDLSANGSTATISPTGSGSQTLTATITNSCGQTATKKVTFYIGTPTFNKFTFGCTNRSLCIASDANYAFTSPTILNTKNRVIANFFGLTAAEAANSANWQWQEAPGNHLLYINNSSPKNYLDLCPIGAGTTILQVRAKNNGCNDFSEWVDLPITIVQLPSSMSFRQTQSPGVVSLRDNDSNTLGNIENTQYLWANNNIWVRNNQDGIIEHQNPVFNENSPNYMYVRIANTGCTGLPGGIRLKTYWAKAATSLNWPQSWNDAKYNNTETSLGGQIGEVALPELGPEQETIISMPFMVPNPDKYNNIVNEPWRFGLLARAVSESDEAAGTETDDLVQNLINNENIALKNVTVVDLANDNPEEQTIGGVIAVGNTFDTPKSFYLELVKEDLETGKPIYDEAEVSLKLDETLYQAWVRGGKTAERLDNTLDDKMKLVKDNNVFLKDLELNPNETGTLYVKFNFLTKEITDKSKYMYHVIQRETGTNKIIGGQTYVIKKQQRPLFTADAGGTKYVDKNEPITISAAQISESAVYNWYDADGNFITSGKDLNIATEIAQKYKLEVIAADGFKDYTEVEVKLNPNTLGTISPNPVVNSANITYKINEASSAYLMILGGYGTTGDSNNYILDIDSSGINIDLSYYSSGFYTVALVCDGQIVDAKTLVKE